MSPLSAPTSQREARTTTRAGRLFVLEVSSGQMFSANPDGLDKTVIVTGARIPDGIALDTEVGLRPISSPPKRGTY